MGTYAFMARLVLVKTMYNLVMKDYTLGNCQGSEVCAMHRASCRTTYTRTNSPLFQEA